MNIARRLGRIVRSNAGALPGTFRRRAPGDAPSCLSTAKAGTAGALALSVPGAAIGKSVGIAAAGTAAAGTVPVALTLAAIWCLGAIALNDRVEWRRNSDSDLHG